MMVLKNEVDRTSTPTKTNQVSPRPTSLYLNESIGGDSMKLKELEPPRVINFEDQSAAQGTTREWYVWPMEQLKINNKISLCAFSFVDWSWCRFAFFKVTS